MFQPKASINKFILAYVGGKKFKNLIFITEKLDYTKKHFFDSTE